MIFAKPAILLLVGATVVHWNVLDEPVDNGLGGESKKLSKAAIIQDGEDNDGKKTSGGKPIPTHPKDTPSFFTKIINVLANPNLRVLVLAMVMVG